MKRIRTKKKMSQGDIARALEVDRDYISNIENGKKNPTLATIQKLANALGVSADGLLKSTLIILLGVFATFVFATFGFASAQFTNPPQGTIIQNQPPAFNYENTLLPQVLPQEEPSTIQPQVLPQEEPSTIQPQVLPQEEPSTIQPQVLPQEEPSTTLPQVLPQEEPSTTLPQVLPQKEPSTTEENTQPRVLPQEEPSTIEEETQPQGTIIQNQPPAFNYENTQPRVLPQEKPSTTEEEIQLQVLPQETLPKIPLVENTTDQKSTSQLNLSSPVAYLTYIIIIIIVIFVFFWFGWWRRWLKREKKTELPSEAEDKKPPTEAEKSEKKTEPPAEAEKLVCPTCGGSGKITKHRTKTAPCTHCKETGIDICHYCSGTGRNGLGYGVPLEDIEGYPKCDYCGGKGFPKLVLPCEFCKGKRKIEFQEPYKETCPTCKGSGWIRNW